MSGKRAWMLGVCGMGMGPLAIYLRERGWDVSGWDDALQPPMSHFLEAAQVRLSRSFDGENPPDLVGHSSAVKPENPLYALARRHDVRLVRRGELLAESVADRQLIAVCGSHGKTTTSGMLIQALLAAEVDAGYVLGGLYRDASLPPARAGKSPWVVAEVDESDGTINHFSPEITVVVNLDWDHPDYYRTEEELEAVFVRLFQRTRRAIFIPAGNERLARLAVDAPVPVFTVGDGGIFAARVVSSGANETALEMGRGFLPGEISLPVTGRFNTSNAILALAVTMQVAGRLGPAPLGRFSGIRRRQDELFSAGGLRVMADYAHHPTEIQALLRYLREQTLGRLVAVFQPHRHTRTRQYRREFVGALRQADRVLLLPVYSAGEGFVEGGGSEDLLAAAEDGEKFSLHGSGEELLAQLRMETVECPEVTVVFVGAGNVDKVAAAFTRDLWLTAARAEGVTRRFDARVRPLLGRDTLLAGEFPLGERTTIGVGGAVDWYAEPGSLEDLRLLLRAAGLADLPVFVMGRGSNLLVPDEGFRGLVLRLNRPCWRELVVDAEEVRLVAGGGVRLKDLALQAAAAGVDGFAFVEGIPGSLGGALRMNAGAHGAGIFERVESVKWLTPDGVLHERERAFFSATYRDCPELHGAVVVEAVLRGTGRAAAEEIRTRMADYAARRRETQPREPSAGCSFKNPPGHPAGKLVDGLGLKGLRVGGACVSEAHGNFIINTGGATAADVIALLRQVRGVVKAEQGIELEPEIILIGKDWRDVL